MGGTVTLGEPEYGKRVIVVTLVSGKTHNIADSDYERYTYETLSNGVLRIYEEKRADSEIHLNIHGVYREYSPNAWGFVYQIAQADAA